MKNRRKLRFGNTIGTIIIFISIMIVTRCLSEMAFSMILEIEHEKCEKVLEQSIQIVDGVMTYDVDAFSSFVEIERILELIGWLEIVLFLTCFLVFFVSGRHLRRSKAETEKQLTISNTLVQCIATLSNGVDMDKSINRVIEIVNGYFKGDRAYLFELDYENQTTSNTYEYAIDGITKEIDNMQNVPISAVSFWIDRFNEAGMFCIGDIEKDIDKDSNTYAILSAQNIRSLISVPIMQKGEIIGFLGVDNPKTNADDLTLLSSAVLFLSDNLEKRYHQELLERLSYEDALTKMYNRNKFDEVVDELKENKPQSLGVAYVDMNGLKKINDEYGHKAGDKFIKRTANNILKIFNSNAYRIGGDEFVVIIPDIDEQTFNSKITSLKALMEQEDLSVSVGTSWVEGNTNIIAQMHESDARMYENKKIYYGYK